MKFLIRIQSTSDLITNSSSEVFLCKNNTDMTIDQLKHFIYQYNIDHQYKGDWEALRTMSDEDRVKYDIGGGMGGFLKVYTYAEAVVDGYDYYFEDIQSPENYLLVDTDWCHRATIAWIQENLNAKCLD